MIKAIKIICPYCHCKSIKKNGKKYNHKQNYFCKDCKKQFIEPSEHSQNGRKAEILTTIVRMLVRGVGIRDIRSMQEVSYHTIYKVIRSLVTDCKPRKAHYGTLEVDESWTYVRSKKRKKWLLYAYDRQEGEIVAYVWGNRSEKTARKLRKKLLNMGIRYAHIATDNWNSFAKVFSKDSHQREKFFTKGIEGNNCTLRHRNRRFSEKPTVSQKEQTVILLCLNIVFVGGRRIVPHEREDFVLDGAVGVEIFSGIMS